jgi:glycerophosphoryl diester phosphodiesterase
MKYAFAHRGGRAHGQDNILPTFVEALARGATGLETDAWVTADGVVVLDHDGVHLPGTADEVPITQVARAQLAAYIPTLDDLYETCGTDFDLAIDVKGDGAGEAICRVAEARGAADRLWLFTPSTTRPDVLGAAHPGVTVRGRELQRGTRNSVLKKLADDGVEAVNARWPFWRRAAVAAVHSRGMLAFAWDVQWPPAVGHCRRLGIDGIFSDHVKLLHDTRPS